MNKVVIDKKSCIVMPLKSFEALQKNAALKTNSEKVLMIEEVEPGVKK